MPGSPSCRPLFRFAPFLLATSLLGCTGSGEGAAGPRGHDAAGGAPGSGGSAPEHMTDGGPPEAGSPPDAGDVPDAPSAVCLPSAGGPHWLTEEDHLTLVPFCATGLQLAPSEFTLEGAPVGLAFSAATGAFEWSPGLDQAGVYDVILRVPSLGDAGRVKISVADRWDAVGNVAVNPLTYTEEFGLPVFHLFTTDALNEDAHTPVRVYYGGRQYQDTQGKYRGQTSLTFPKKSFTLKFSWEDLLSDAPRGLVAERRVVLTTTFDDNSHLRQRLAYSLWNRMSASHIQLAAFSAVVFKDGEYQGVYAVTDHVDGDLMEDHGLHRDGNLYKARSHAANFRLVLPNGAPKPVLWSGYTKEEGDELNIDGGQPSYADLEALVSWVATSSDDEFSTGLGQRVAQEEFEDWWIFVSLICAADSAGKNSYLYHDARPEAEGSLFRYVPWDFNASFGQDWATERVAHDVNPETYGRFNRLFERLLADARIRGPLVARYDGLLRAELDVEAVLALVDAWAEEVRDAAIRDARKWDAAFRAHEWHDRTDFTTHEEEVAYLRNFITERWRYVDALY